MNVEPGERSSLLLWREQTGQWLKPASIPARPASLDQSHDNYDPDDLPAAPARPWQRMFPGL